MKLYFPYDIDNPQNVFDEPHTVIGGRICLEHVPLQDSILIGGLKPANSRARLQPDQFFCQYRADTMYREANRVVYFHADLNGKIVRVSYKAVGSPFTYEDANEIKTFMDETRAEITQLRAAVAVLQAKLAAGGG